MKIRLAKINDLKSIVEIYNQAVLTKKSTADLTQVKITDRIDWFYEHSPGKYPIYIAEVDEIVTGWISLSPYRKGREALRHTAEVSYFIDNRYQRQGIGTSLIDFIIMECKKIDIKNIFAIVLENNKASIKLLKKFNFNKWGYMPDVAEFDGAPCGHLYFGLNIK